MKNIISIFIVFIAVAFAVMPKLEGAMVDVARAAVRVSTDEGGGMKSVGSGGIVGSDDSSYLVVTCEHVANRSTANVEIVRFGQSIKTVKGTVVGRDAKSDCAFIRIKKADLGDIVPGLLPVDAAFDLKPGDLLWGASFPQGGAMTIFEMSYIGMTADGWIEAKPSIKQGRSGGIVVDAEGTRVIGITWGTSEDRCYIVPAKRFAKAVGKELANVEAPVAALDFTVAEKAIFRRGVNGEPKRFRPPTAGTPRRPWRLTPRQRPDRPAPEGIEIIDPNAPIQPSSTGVDKTGIKIHDRTSFRGQSTAGSCPGGTCPTPGFESIQTTRPKSADVKPALPLPLAQADEGRKTSLPFPSDEAPTAVAKKPLPIVTIQDPRLDKIPGIEQTLFGLSSGQTGIEKKVDDTLQKVGQLIDDKKDAVKVDLETFRNDTLIALDERTATIKEDIDSRLALVQGELQKLEATNAEIAKLKESIDNFSLFPDASGFCNWLADWGWFLTMFATVVVLGGLQARQFYENNKKNKEVNNVEQSEKVV